MTTAMVKSTKIWLRCRKVSDVSCVKALALTLTSSEYNTYVLQQIVQWSPIERDCSQVFLDKWHRMKIKLGSGIREIVSVSVSVSVSLSVCLSLCVSLSVWLSVSLSVSVSVSLSLFPLPISIILSFPSPSPHVPLSFSLSLSLSLPPSVNRPSHHHPTSHFRSVLPGSKSCQVAGDPHLLDFQRHQTSLPVPCAYRVAILRVHNFVHKTG